MGIIARQSLINTVISYVGVVLGILLTLWLYLVALEPAEYGLTRVMISVAFIGAQFADFGFKNITIRYFPYFKDRKERHYGFLFWLLAIPAFGFLLLCLLLYGFKAEILSYYNDNSPLLKNYYNLLVLLILFTLYFSLLSSYMHAFFHTVLVSFLQEILLRLLIIFVLIAYLMQWIDQKGFVFLFVTAYGVLPLILLIYLAFEKQLVIKPDLRFFKIKKMKELATYGFFAVLGGAATIIVGKIDILMLSAMVGLSDTGVYAIAFYVGSVITIPQRSIFKIANPIIADAFKKGDMETVDDVYKKSSLNQLIAGGLLFIGIWANLQNLAQIIPAEYFTHPSVILVIGLAKLFNMATGTNGGIILNSPYYRADLYSNLLLIIVAVATNYLLIPLYGILGAAIATAISIFLYNFGKYLLVWYAYSLQPFTFKTVQVLLISAVTGVVSLWFLPDLPSVWGDLIFKSAVITIFYTGVIIVLNISEDLNGLIKNFLKISV